MGKLILASGSRIRAKLLENAGVMHDVMPARVDEYSIRMSLEAALTKPRDIADALAEAKAMKVSAKTPDTLVLGCDQIAEFKGRILSKPRSKEELADQLRHMRGKQHRLFSAAVLTENGRAVWRHVGTVRLEMRELSESYILSYLDRNWDSVREAVGGYKLEEEGVRLFSKIEGDYFNVLGLPLIELLSYLGIRGVVET